MNDNGTKKSITENYEWYLGLLLAPPSQFTLFLMFFLYFFDNVKKRKMSSRKANREDA